MEPITAKKALELIESVPAEKFITNKFTDSIGCCCVLGHLARLISPFPNDYSKLNCYIFIPLIEDFRNKTTDFLLTKHSLDVWDGIANVNNEPTINGYTEPVIKDRVVHLLKDMVEAGY